MEAKEKAKELVEKMMFHSTDEAKQCALIAVYEILKLNLKYGNKDKNGRELKDYYDYWDEVKQEIVKQ